MGGVMINTLRLSHRDVWDLSSFNLYSCYLDGDNKQDTTLSLAVIVILLLV